MIFFLSSLILASALDFPSWGGYLYGADEMSYTRFAHRQGCMNNQECAPLRSGTFSGVELDICRKSLTTQCSILARPNTAAIENVQLIYHSWYYTDDDLVPPSWAAGCNDTILSGTVYATSIQRFQDYFATIPQRDFKIKEGFFRLKLNRRLESLENFDLYLGDFRDMDKGCSILSLNIMTQLNIHNETKHPPYPEEPEEPEFDGYNILVPYEDILNQGSMLVSYHQSQNPTQEPHVYVSRMSFESERFLAEFWTNSATSVTSLSLYLILSLAFVTFTM